MRAAALCLSCLPASEKNRWRPRAHYVAVGAFVLAAIVLAFVAVLWLGRVEFAQELKRYYIFFRGSVAGLSKGSYVQYNGIPVGQVVDIRVDPDDLEKIQVTVEIDTNIVDDQDRRPRFPRSQPLQRRRHDPDPRWNHGGQGTRAGAEHRYPVIAAGQSDCSASTESQPSRIAGPDLMVTVAHNLNAVLDEQNRKAISDSLQNVRTITENFVAPSKEVSELVEQCQRRRTRAEIVSWACRSELCEPGRTERSKLSQTLNDADRLAKEPQRHEPADCNRCCKKTAPVSTNSLQGP